MTAASSPASLTAAAAVFRSIARQRRSTHRFQTGRTIDSVTLRDILHSTLRSPSSHNLQPSQIVLVQNAAVKNELSQKAMLGAGNQYRTRDCSALAVFLSDLEASQRIQRIYELERQWGKRHPAYLSMMPLSTSFLLGEGHAATAVKQVATSLVSEYSQQPMPYIDSIASWSVKHTSFMVQSYVLAATSYDLATCIMEGFDPRRMKEILRIPDRYSIPMVVATGYDYADTSKLTEESLTPRLGIEEVVFRDVFGTPFTTDDDETRENEHDESEEKVASSS